MEMIFRARHDLPTLGVRSGEMIRFAEGGVPIRPDGNAIRDAVAWFRHCQDDSFVVIFVDSRVGVTSCRAPTVEEAEELFRDMVSGSAPTTLDAWLKADLAGTIVGSAVTSGLDRPGCIVTSQERRALHRNSERRRATWPRACKNCGDSFSPERLGVLRCPRCRKHRRSA